MAVPISQIAVYFVS